MQINKGLLIEKYNISIEINKNKRRKLYKYSMNRNRAGGVSKKLPEGDEPLPVLADSLLVLAEPLHSHLSVGSGTAGQGVLMESGHGMMLGIAVAVLGITGGYG